MSEIQLVFLLGAQTGNPTFLVPEPETGGKVPAVGPPLPIVARCKMQQSIIAQCEQRRCQKRIQRLVIQSIGEERQHARDQLHLVGTGKRRSACNQAFEPRIAQRLGIHVDIRHGAQEDHHIPGLFACLAQVAELRGYTFGAGFSAGAHARTARHALIERHRDTRAIGEHRVVMLVHLPLGRERKEVLPEHLILREHAIYQRKDIGMAAEVVGQAHELQIGAALLQHGMETEEHVDIGAAETVDALLGIAHRAHVRIAVFGQGPYQGNLQLVGILELVHHDHLEPAEVPLRYGRVPHQRLVGKAQQVDVVQR